MGGTKLIGDLPQGHAKGVEGKVVDLVREDITRRCGLGIAQLCGITSQCGISQRCGITPTVWHCVTTRIGLQR